MDDSSVAQWVTLTVPYAGCGSNLCSVTVAFFTALGKTLNTVFEYEQTVSHDECLPCSLNLSLIHVYVAPFSLNPCSL